VSDAKRRRRLGMEVRTPTPVNSNAKTNASTLRTRLDRYMAADSDCCPLHMTTLRALPTPLAFKPQQLSRFMGWYRQSCEEHPEWIWEHKNEVFQLFAGQRPWFNTLSGAAKVRLALCAARLDRLEPLQACMKVVAQGDFDMLSVVLRRFHLHAPCSSASHRTHQGPLELQGVAAASVHVALVKRWSTCPCGDAFRLVLLGPASKRSSLALSVALAPLPCFGVYTFKNVLRFLRAVGIPVVVNRWLVGPGCSCALQVLQGRPLALDACPTAWPHSGGEVAVRTTSSLYAFQAWLVSQGISSEIRDCQAMLCYYSSWLNEQEG
jgi:hypothetical protein